MRGKFTIITDSLSCHVAVFSKLLYENRLNFLRDKGEKFAIYKNENVPRSLFESCQVWEASEVMKAIFLTFFSFIWVSD